MKPARILIILVAASFAAAVDGMGLRPLPADKFLPKRLTTEPPRGSEQPGQSPSQGEVPLPADEVSAAEIDQLTKSGDAVVIDARPVEQYTEGHIPFSLSLPFEAFAGGKPESLEFFPPDQMFIIYCGGGDCDASEKVKVMLEAHGFSNIKVYHQGWPGWLEFKGEVEAGPPKD